MVLNVPCRDSLDTGFREWPASAECRHGTQRVRAPLFPAGGQGLVAVVVRLVRAFHRHADIFGLRGCQSRQLDADFLEVQPGDFFVQFLRKHVNAGLVLVFVSPQIELRQRLIRKAVGHHETRVPGRAAEVHEASFGENEERIARRESIHIHLRLDAGITVTNVKVKESPAWLQNKLKAVGLRPINNIVDITNYILFETGQPLHAFDADKIAGNKIIVKKLAAGTKFTTLDEVERELLPTDLMICNTSEGMCIAGVFGGAKSGVTESTHNIFIESAYFDTVHVRKTSKHHGLKTDASFRFERGVDPNMVIFALKHAAMLMKEIAGGSISSDIVDVYPEPIKNFSADINYANVDKLIGKVIDRNTIKKILASLEIEIVSETTEGLALSVPPFKVDVLREADVVEEILRIYGYNNVEEPQQFRISPSKAPDPDKKRYKTPLLITLAVAGSTRS